MRWLSGGFCGSSFPEILEEAALALAGRWAEAAAVVDAARALVAEHAVFRRNAALIDVTAGAGAGRLSSDLMLHYVFAGRWVEAVDLFRNYPLLPGFLADGPRHDDGGGLAAPPWLPGVRNATARARRIAPARAEIEFLHAWAAFHLDPDTATMEPLRAGDRARGPGRYGRRVPPRRAQPRRRPDPRRPALRRGAADRREPRQRDPPRRDAAHVLLFDGVGESCAGLGCGAPDLRPEAVPPAASGAAAWNPWRPPSAGPAAAAALHADLMRHFAATSLDADAASDQVTAFPLAGGSAAGRRFWAIFHPAADLCRIARRAGEEARFGCTKPVLVVHARRDGAWREVAHYVVPRLETVSVVAPVAVEPSQAWIVIRGGDADAPGTSGDGSFWQLLRFDGDSLHVEVEGYWHGFMIADVDDDGAGEILRRDAVPICFDCGVTRREVRLYRWTGTRLARVPLEFLPAGSAPAAAVAANNRAVALARARRWTEAAAVLDTVRPLVGGHPAFGRNASLIDLNAKLARLRLRRTRHVGLGVC